MLANRVRMGANTAKKWEKYAVIPETTTYSWSETVFNYNPGQGVQTSGNGYRAASPSTDTGVVTFSNLITGSLSVHAVYEGSSSRYYRYTSSSGGTFRVAAPPLGGPANMAPRSNYLIRTTYKRESSMTPASRGDFIEIVKAKKDTYPADGIHTDGFWYVLI